MTTPPQLDVERAAIGWRVAAASGDRDVTNFAYDHMDEILAEIDQLRDRLALAERHASQNEQAMLMQQQARFDAEARLALAEQSADRTAESFAERLTEADYRAGQAQEALEACRESLALAEQALRLRDDVVAAARATVNAANARGNNCEMGLVSGLADRLALLNRLDETAPTSPGSHPTAPTAPSASEPTVAAGDSEQAG